MEKTNGKTGWNLKCRAKDDEQFRANGVKSDLEVVGEGVDHVDEDKGRVEESGEDEGVVTNG